VRRVDRLRVSGNEASAVLTFDSPAAERVDRLTLRRVDGSWRIAQVRRTTTVKPPAPARVKTLEAEWTRPVAPFRILGNLYYVGASQLSAFLLTTPAGHVLLDTGPVEMVPMLERNIAALGFRLADVRVLLNSHAHYDHCGGFAEVRRRTGARVLASEADAELMQRGGRGDFAYGDDFPYEPLTPDQRIHDGETVELGDLRLIAMLTPGHTRGCTTWSVQVVDGGRTYDVLFLCGLTVSPFKLTGNQAYPAIVGDARRSLASLRAVRADVFLAAHGFWFDLLGKAKRLRAARRTGGPNPFVDPEALPRHLGEMEQDLDQALEAQQRAATP
jgi:metallo-beta-lactamase class B